MQTCQSLFYVGFTNGVIRVFEICKESNISTLNQIASVTAHDFGVNCLSVFLN
jgi:hypothetical protein